VVVAGITLKVVAARSAATRASELAAADTASAVTRREVSVGALSGSGVAAGAAGAIRVVLTGIVCDVAKALSANPRESGFAAADLVSAVTILLELTTLGWDSSASAEAAKLIIPRILMLLARCK
jgi:hypothetical protein